VNSEGNALVLVRRLSKITTPAVTMKRRMNRIAALQAERVSSARGEAAMQLADDQAKS